MPFYSPHGKLHQSHQLKGVLQKVSVVREGILKTTQFDNILQLSELEMPGENTEKRRLSTSLKGTSRICSMGSIFSELYLSPN